MTPDVAATIPIRLLGMLAGWLPSWRAVTLHLRGRVTLKEAATRLYEQTSPSHLSAVAEMANGNTPDGILSWCASYIRGQMDVLGFRPPSRIEVLIPGFNAVTFAVE